MAFEKLRQTKGNAKPGVCGVCGKNPKAGSLKVVLYDDALKVVASRSVQVCEEYGERGYAEATAQLP
jgi:hypothetical protein